MYSLFSYSPSQLRAAGKLWRRFKVPPGTTSNTTGRRWVSDRGSSDLSLQATDTTKPPDDALMPRARIDMMKAYRHSFSESLYFASRMKAAMMKPDLSTYNALLEAAARDGQWLYSWAILDDMISMGVRPNIETFNQLIFAQRQCTSLYALKALDKMRSCGFSPDATTHSHMIRRWVAGENLEMALQCFHEMVTSRVHPERQAVECIIGLAAKLKQARLAVDIAAWAEENFAQVLEKSIWMSCLAACADALYLEGTVQCWERVATTENLNPTEGVCLAVLRVAGRYGQPELANDVLSRLESNAIPLQEHHYVSLVDAYIVAGQLREALSFVNGMSEYNIQPRISTLDSLQDYIQQNPNSLDQVSDYLDEIQTNGKKVPIATLNVVIASYIAFGDIPRAMATYKDIPEFGANADLTTFNLLLKGCVVARHRELVSTLLEDMRKSKIKPNHETYENMIRFCLTQEVYEDAFYYLEEMKAAKIVPSASIYGNILEKCCSVDDERADLVLSEMDLCGYHVPHNQHRPKPQSNTLD